MMEEKKPLTRGIVIIALRQNYYARMAYNLSLSLIQPQNGLVRLCLVHDHTIDELSQLQRFNFAKKRKLEGNEAANPFFVKLNLYDLSPFDETLFLDADTLWLPHRSVDSLFEELSTVDFAIANRGYLTASSGGYDWADVGQMAGATGTGKFLSCSSEVVYFKKTEKVKELFELAKLFYLTNSVVNASIGGFQPDEPSFAYTIEKTAAEIKTNWLPSYWEGNHTTGNMVKPIKELDLYNNYYLLSVGGKQVSDHIAGRSGKKGIYNKLMNIYSKGGAFFPYEHKKTLIPERKTI